MRRAGWHSDAPRPPTSSTTSTRTDITEVGRIAGQERLDGAVVLDGTVTGNAASLETSGTLSGNGLAYGDNKILDLDSKYAVTVADLDFVECPRAGDEHCDVCRARRRRDQPAHRHDDLRAEAARVRDDGAGAGRELAATGNVIFHPDHQELHLPKLALTTQGIEWRNVAGSEAAIQYRQNE